VKPLRFGVVGCGAISTLYQLPALKRCAQLELRAMVDVDGDHASKVARRFGASESYADYRALDGHVDAALIATPNTTHADIACELLGRGIHVLCEKPMATSRADVDRMLAAAERSGARLMAAHCLRFSPNLAMLKGAIERGWLGPVRSMSAAIGGPYDAGAQRTDFRRQRRLSGGGVLIDLGIHLVDLAIWFAGEAPVDVAYDSSAGEGWEVEQDAEVALRFAHAGSASLTASFSRFMDSAFTVRGEAGWARAPLYQPTQLTLFSQHARICQKAGTMELAIPNANMYEQQIEHFCAAIRSGAPFRVRSEEVRASIDVVGRCYGMAVAA
jgi:predicted dehydrogenase